jgi:sulfite exporter TauE/SafE
LTASLTFGLYVICPRMSAMMGWQAKVKSLNLVVQGEQVVEAFKLLGAGFGMGWGPCLAFCGPILLPYVAATKGGWRAGLRVSAIFSLGRLFGLVILGGLASVAFASINRFFPPHRSGYLYLAMAIFILFLGVLIILGKGFRVPFYRSLRERILERGTASMLGLGFLIGISPCVPLVAILTYIACTTTSILRGIGYALCFGIGTIVPVMILGPLVGFLPEKVFKSSTHLRIFRMVCGAILILFGLQLLYCTWQVL